MADGSLERSDHFVANTRSNVTAGCCTVWRECLDQRVRHTLPTCEIRTLLPVTTTETVNNAIGNHRIHPQTDCVGWVEVDVPTSRASYGTCMVEAHAPRRFPRRQWRRMFFHRGNPVYSYLSGWLTSCIPTSLGRYTTSAFLDRFCGCSGMVWGISHGFKSPLVVVRGNIYIDI